MPGSASLNPSNAAGRRAAMNLILVLGLVSAFGDITYESARSVSGPFFLTLGAGAAAIGFVSGLGELLGYGLRLVFGVIADRLRAHWTATFVGYGLLLSVPLLALVHDWRAAALLLILERIGKAIRSPSRDTIISYATHHTGRGWGFAIHEFLDQIGAVIGPLLLALVFFRGRSYQTGFGLLLVPAVLAMVALVVARARVPRPKELEDGADPPSGSAASAPTRTPRTFWLYAAFTFVSVSGFAGFQILSYHWVRTSLVPASGVAVLFAIAMGVDALAALAAGKAYDRFGLRVLLAVPLLSAAVPLVSFAPGLAMAGLGAVLWGVVMSLHETIMRAAVADISDSERRATAYGTFNVVYGAAWFVGSSVIGVLYDLSLACVGVFVAGVEVAAMLIFVLMRREAHPRRFAPEEG